MDGDEEARRVEEAAAGSAPAAGGDEDWEMSEDLGDPAQPASEDETPTEGGRSIAEQVEDGTISQGPPPEEGEPEGEPAEPAPAPDAEPAKTTIRKVTEYVVLVEKRVQMGEEPVVMWQEVGVFPGPKALDLAHRTFEGKEHGALVAVPTRSWKPKRPKPKPPKEPAVSWE